MKKENVVFIDGCRTPFLKSGTDYINLMSYELGQFAINGLLQKTGLDPKRIFVADHVSRFYETHGNRVNLVPVFGIEVDSDLVLLSSEHSEYKWVGYDDAYSHLVWNGQKKGISIVNEMVTSNDDRMKWSEVDIS